MDFENEVRKVADRYAKDGYVVVIRPGRDQLGPFAVDYEVSIVGTKGDQGVIVEVKRNRKDLSDDRNLSQFAEITDGEAGLEILTLSSWNPKPQQ